MLGLVVVKDGLTKAKIIKKQKKRGRKSLMDQISTLIILSSSEVGLERKKSKPNQLNYSVQGRTYMCTTIKVLSRMSKQ